MSRLFDALAEVVPASQIGPWLDIPNSAFEGSTPLQVIERGESDRLWRMIWELRIGNSGDCMAKPVNSIGASLRDKEGSLVMPQTALLRLERRPWGSK